VITRIYSLTDPRSGRVRYVGKTAYSLGRRLRQHLAGAKHLRTHLGRWLQQLLTEGSEPTIQLLETVSGEGWSLREQHWIVLMRERGEPLTNSTAGGDGAPPGFRMREDTKAKIAAALSGQRVERVIRACAWCRRDLEILPRRVRHSGTGRFFCDSRCLRAHRGASKKPLGPRWGVGSRHTEETRAKIAASKRANPQTQLIGAASRYWATRRGDDILGPVAAHCGHCGAAVTRKPSQLRKSKSGEVFCSKSCSVQCQHAAAGHGREFACGWCGAPVQRSQAHAKRPQSGKVFCSRSHAGLYRFRVAGEKPPSRSAKAPAPRQRCTGA
jgi:hypothetical protein